MKTVNLLLSGKKGLITLERLVENDINLPQIHNVVIGEDKYVQEDYFSDIEKLCNIHGIRMFCNETSANYHIAIGWKKIIRDTGNLIILHDSLLPKYRGFAPLVNALLNKDKSIGVTAFFAVDEVDAGRVIDQRSIDVSYPITIAEAIDAVGKLYADIVQDLFIKFRENANVPSKPQDGKVSYSIWRGEDDYRIDWDWDAGYICRFVDAVGFPYMGASTAVESRYRIWKCEEVPDINISDRDKHVGKVFSIENGYPVVICGRGMIRIVNMTMYDGSFNLLPWKKLKVHFK